MSSTAFNLAAALLVAGSVAVQAQQGAESGVQGAATPAPRDSSDRTVFTGCVQRAAEAAGARDEASATEYVLTDASPASASGADRSLGTATGTPAAGTSPAAPTSGTSADTTTSGSGAAAASGGSTGTSGRADGHRILGLSGDDLDRFVGQRVEVRGRMTDDVRGTQRTHRDRHIAAEAEQTESIEAGGETMSPRPAAGVEAGAAGTAGTTGDTRGRAATTATPPTAGDTATRPGSEELGERAPEPLASFDVESVRVIGGNCDTDGQGRRND